MNKIKALTLCLCLFCSFLFIGAVSSTTVSAAEDLNFPVFEYEKVVIDPADMNYNPTGEYDFPTVINASEYFDDPLGKYYIYYGPHDGTGGISLAYSDNLEGPWTEYESNPLISNDWQPHYSVSHVASAHPIWVEEEGKLFLYFHGENSKTRLATSEDGIHFEYEQIVVDTTDFDDISEASYARVFEYTIPDKQNKYVMMLMGNNRENRKIYLAWSDDGREWETQRTPFISPVSNEEIDHKGNISGAYYFPWNGKHYVTIHAGSGNQYIVEVGENFDQEIHHGPFYESSSSYPENGRAASRSFIQEGNTVYMFYEAGQRGDTKIALAKSVPEEELKKFDSLTISIDSPLIRTGESRSVEIEAKRKNGHQINIQDASVEYLTSDSETATFADGTLTGKKEGEVDISVRMTYEGVTLESNPITIQVLSEGDIWNLLNEDFSSLEGGWSIAKGSASTGSITLEEGSVHLVEENTNDRGTYHYLTKNDFIFPTGDFSVEFEAAVNKPSTGNEFSFRVNGRLLSVFLTYDGEEGRVQNRGSTPDQTAILNTEVNHVYRMVVHSNYTYDLYVDGEYLWSSNSRGDSGSNLIKIGADTPYTADMDIDALRMGDGLHIPEEKEVQQLTDVRLSSNSTAIYPGETSFLQLKAYLEDGSELDKSEVDITYQTNQPDIVQVTNNGQIVVQEDVKDIRSFNIWAKVTYNNDTVQSGLLVFTIAVNAKLLQQTMDFYNQTGELENPVYSQLKNRVRQAEHHLAKGNEQKAVKHYRSFKQHLLKQELQKFSSEEARNVLEADVAYIIDRLAE